MADRIAEGFSIGVLAARAGVTPGVLRTWENRFGFPRGERSASGKHLSERRRPELISGPQRISRMVVNCMSRQQSTK